MVSNCYDALLIIVLQREQYLNLNSKSHKISQFRLINRTTNVLLCGG